MKNFLLLFLTFFTLAGFSQLYLGDKKETYYYVEIKGDSARLEIFKDNLYFVNKKHDEILTKNKDATNSFGTQNRIIKQKNKFYILYKDALSTDIVKIKLEPCTKDLREALRKEAYYCKKSTLLNRLQDSLAGPKHSSSLSLNRSTDTTYSELYFKETNSLFDQLSKEVVANADKTTLEFYKSMDSLYKMKPEKIFTLLNKAKYDFYYGTSLIYTTATLRPEVLILYVDKNNFNKLIILKTIRDHIYLKEIITKVKACRIQSYAKSEILKQNSKRNARDKAGKGLIVGLVLAQIALIATLIIVALK